MVVSRAFKNQLVAHLLNPVNQLKIEINQRLAGIEADLHIRPIGECLSQIQQLPALIEKWKQSGPPLKEITLIDQEYKKMSALIEAKLPRVSKVTLAAFFALGTIALIGLVISMTRN